VEVAFGPAARQNRATVVFRAILAIPAAIVLYFITLAAYVVIVITWFAALFTAQVPDWAANFITGWLRWLLRVYAYYFLLTDKYPPFSLDPVPDFPVDVAARPVRLNRAAVFFRLILGIPAAFLLSFVLAGMGVFAIVTWVATLIRGAQPPLFYEANAAGLRYLARFYGYMGMVTSTYPAQLMGDTEPVPIGAGTGSVPAGGWGAQAVPPAGASPWSLRLTGGARRLMVAFIVVGVVAYGAYIAIPISLGVSQGIKSVNAQNQVATAYNTLNHQASDYESAANACSDQATSPSDLVQCVQHQDALFAQDLGAYQQALSRISYPSGVSSQAAAAESAASQAQAVMETLSTAPVGQYESVARAANLTAKLTAVDRTAHALNDALLNP
jgi:hypothetical protein